MKELDRIILFRIVSIRKEKGYIQADVAKKLGLERSTYARKEKGSIPLTLKELSLIMDLLKISPETLCESCDHIKNTKTP